MISPSTGIDSYLPQFRNSMPGKWTPILSSTQSNVAKAIGREVASRLKDRNQIETALLAAKRQTSLPKSIQWKPHSTGQGYAGLALMCAHLDRCFPHESWCVSADEYFQLAAWGAEGEPQLSIGLFSGVSGTGFAAWYAGKGTSRYERLVQTIDQILIPKVDALVAEQRGSLRKSPVSTFDLISGLSGVAAYLLCRSSERDVENALRRILITLIEVSKLNEPLPNWFTPRDCLGEGTALQIYPHGNLNCGLAHGIPGPLAVMSIALLRGLEVAGMADAVRGVCEWLGNNRIDDVWGVNWPTAIPVRRDEGSSSEVLSALPATLVPGGPSRSAWCYGSPGVARALWLAGCALDDAAYRELAVRAMKATYRRPLEERNIDSPTFCHGIAGLLQITLRFYHDTRDPLFADAGTKLFEQLIALYQPNSRLGFCALEPGGLEIDQPALLDGVAGVVLALQSAACDVGPDWDRLFLLS